MSPKERKLMEQLCKLKQPQLIKVMKQFLKKYYDNVISSSYYLIAVGDAPVGLVAHLDTVFNSPPKDIYYDKEKNIMLSPEGLGADDRAGVYAIINIVKSGLRPTVMLTTDEEYGCIGAERLVKKIAEPPMALKYLIELDRRGEKDCVFYSCNNTLFTSYIESFGFITEMGTFSDISVICPKWKIAGVNLSIGYYHEHTPAEILHIGQLFNTIDKVKQMITDSHQIPNPFEYIEDKLYKYKMLQCAWDPSWGISEKDWEFITSPQMVCYQCGAYDFEYNMTPTKMPDDATAFFCPECLSNNQHIHWCCYCGEAFYTNSTDENDWFYCNDCRGKINGTK